MNTKHPQQSYLSKPYKKRSYGSHILLTLTLLMVIMLIYGLVKSLGV